MRARTAARFFIALVGAALALAPAGTAPVAATFPGGNGLIAFTDTTEGGFLDIFTVQPDGTGLTNLTNTPAVDELYPAFSSDSARIAYVRVECFGDYCESRVSDLWVMNADGAGATNITNGSFLDIAAPAWSPDGESLAAVGTINDGRPDAYGLWTVTAATGSATQLVGAFWVGVPEWSPDGTQIAFSAYGGWARSEMSVYVIPTTGGVPSVVAPGNVGAASPSWSPDGSRIAYFDLDDIHLVDPDGSNNVLVGTGGEPVWSPDGTQIAFTYYDAGIWVMDANGANPTQVTLSGTDPNWGVGGIDYAFSGFFAPVDNEARNLVKAGSAVPVKFSLGGDQGLDIFAAGYPKYAAVACDTSLPVDGIETVVAASTSGLQYDAVADQYTYVWKTLKGWSGCGELQLKLIDGSMHIAQFQFR